MTLTPDSTRSPRAELNVRQFTNAPLQMEGEFVFDAPAEVLFEHVSDPHNLAAWFPTIHNGSTDHSTSDNQGEWGTGSKRYCET